MMAIEEAMTSPLLEDADIYGARGVVLYINYGNGIKMRELDMITETIQSQTQTDCELIWGVCKDDTLGDDISITLIATGYQSGEISKERIRTQRQSQPKVVHTMDLRPLHNQTKQEVAQTQQTEEKIVVENKEEIPVIDSTIKVDASTVLLEISNEEEPTFDIKIVDKPRTEMMEEMLEEKKTKHVTAKQEKEEDRIQFSLFETKPVNEEMHIAQDMVADQDLERDLIKKRISIEMQKHNISLHELEKEPAYKRYGYDLEDSMPSQKSNFSNYTIYSNAEEPGKIEIRPNAMKDITLD
jgi:cell division protein FtsZ